MFTFHNYTRLENFIDVLNAHLSIERCAPTWANWEEGRLISEVKTIPGFDTNEHKTIQFSGKTVQYIFFEGYTERAKRLSPEEQENSPLRDDRINSMSSNFLIFECENQVYGIVFSGITYAKPLVKDIFPSEIWGNVEPKEFELTEDLLYWIFKRHIDLRSDSLSENHQVFVTALESYKGKTRDKVNAVRGEGSRISTILGTLAFLFDNEELKVVRPKIQDGNEVILVELSLTGTFKYWPKLYRGSWTGTLEGIEKQNAVAIYIVVRLIPLLIECYDENKRKNEWSPQLRVDFLKRLGEEIRDRVTDELNRIEQGMNQNLDLEDALSDPNLDLDDEELDVIDEDDMGE